MVTVRAVAGDPDSDALNYSWSATGGAVDGTGRNVRWNAANLARGSYRINATISDGKGGSTYCGVAVQHRSAPESSANGHCLSTMTEIDATAMAIRALYSVS